MIILHDLYIVLLLFFNLFTKKNFGIENINDFLVNRLF